MQQKLELSQDHLDRADPWTTAKDHFLLRLMHRRSTRTLIQMGWLCWHRRRKVNFQFWFGLTPDAASLSFSSNHARRRHRLRFCLGPILFFEAPSLSLRHCFFPLSLRHCIEKISGDTNLGLLNLYYDILSYPLAQRPPLPPLKQEVVMMKGLVFWPAFCSN